MQVLQIILLIIILALLIGGRKGYIDQFIGRGRRRLIVDSCGLIDGRITEIVRTGFMVDELVIPQFILNELQMLADGNDSHKRERARYGLDIANELRDSAPMKVTVDRTVFADIQNTDDKLIALAKKLPSAALYTTDFNLGKVASIEGVSVLNVNELSQSLRPIALPGEALTIKILQKGSNRGQGVGYLEDGTMIVIEGGERFVGRSVPITVTRMHQTVAGKMVFGQVQAQVAKAKDSSASPQAKAKQHAKHVSHDKPKAALAGRFARKRIN